MSLSEKRNNTLLPWDKAMAQWIRLPSGKQCQVINASDTDFRTWYLDILAQLDTVSFSPEIIRVREECQQEPHMDEFARWYFINEVYRLRRFRKSGITLFVEACA